MSADFVPTMPPSTTPKTDEAPTTDDILRAVVGFVLRSAFLLVLGVPPMAALTAAVIYDLWRRAKALRPQQVADQYPPCIGCGERTTWVAKSRAEIVWHHLDVWVRQYFDCTDCDIRARLVRPLDSPVWDYSQAHVV